MKKFAALFVSLVLALGMAACNENEEASMPSEPSGSQEAPDGASPAETEEASPAPSVPNDGTQSQEGSGNTLVVYFSATGNTEEAASVIARLTGGDLFELEPVNPYAGEDLNYGDENSRVSREYADESLRHVDLTADTVDNWGEYDTVFIGYPIWWGIAAWPVNTFVEANDFTGKTVIPFCTSASSGLGESGELLARLAGSGNWLEGQRFSSRVDEEDVQAWLDGLSLSSEETSGAAEPASAAAGEASGSNILIAYFTMPEDVDVTGVDAVAGSSVVVVDGQVMGNVEYMARTVQQTVGGDLFQIETVEQYPLNHDSLVDQAADEQDENARPQLSGRLESLEQYDVVFLGYPNWWGDLPMALYSFLEEYDFSGKTIIPFCPHGGSGFFRTERTIAELQPGATVSEDGLTISRESVSGSAQAVAVWAEGLGL